MQFIVKRLTQSNMAFSVRYVVAVYILQLHQHCFADALPTSPPFFFFFARKSRQVFAGSKK